MLQRLGIRGKLLLVVAVPTIVLLMLSSFVVFNTVTSLVEARNTTQLVQVVERGTPLIEQLQAERKSASEYLRALNDGENKRLTARSQVNSAYFGVRNAAGDDETLKGFVDALDALWGGSTAEVGIDAARAVAEVPPGVDAFPQWPDAAQVEESRSVFTALAADIEKLSLTAPEGPLGEGLRALPGLLRTEAEATAAYLTDARESALMLPDNFKATDAARAGFASKADGLSSSGGSARVAELADSVLGAYETIDNLRIRVRDDGILPTAASSEYSTIIDNLILMEREVGNTIGDQRLASYVNAHASVQDLVEAVRSEEVYVDRQIRQGGWLAGEFNEFQSLYFASNAALDNARRAVEPLDGIDPIREFGASFQLGQGGFESIRNSLLDNKTAESLVQAREAKWSLQVDEELEVITPIRTELFSVVKSRSAELERNNLVQTIATLAAGVVVVTASLLLTQAIARRIINPLRRLTTTASAVRQELPRLVERVAIPGQSVDVSEVQIPVESQDEVGRLAEAFNSVNAATLSIAAEQAALRGSISEMFVNVARRDQVLLNRQLASIDEMERTQDDPDTLTKLFALDHLATRMRRNSESLLVLAGIDTGRRLRRPMPLSDVIRTASSEIELYERVSLELDADPAMLGHSALTAAHLFAELLENATVFSDPGSSVVVRTIEEDGSFVVTISDSGIGMSPEELAEANSRVASTAASEILGAQRLGLFVVGRIARRVGARVYIESAEGKGTVATVVMPPSLFDLSAGVGAPVRSESVADDALHAPAALVQHASQEEAPARGSAYTPAAIQEGTSLKGREALIPEPPARSASVSLDRVPDSDPIPVPGMEPAAAELPADVAAEFDDLPSVTEVGLPTRRRKAGGPEAPQETGSIIGLPQRASDEQLSALAGAATTGFTPILAVEEVSAESAEQRSRVFRGFRSIRETGAAATESQALPMRQSRRPGEAEFEPQFDLDDEPVADASPVVEDAAPEPEPTMEAIPDPAPAPVPDPVAELPAAQEAPAAEEATPEEPVFEPDAPRTEPSASSGQSPLISRGYEVVPTTSGPVPISELAALAPADMIVPQLEEDEEPYVPRAAAALVDQTTGPVESVSLEEEPVAPVRSPLYPAPAATWQRGTQPISQALPYVTPDVAQQPYVPYAPYAANPLEPAPYQAEQAQPVDGGFTPSAPTPFVADPVTSTPSLDELILEGARVDGATDRSSFFGKLFGGKPRKPEPPQQRPAALGPVVEPAGPLSGAIPMRQDPAPQPFQFAQAQGAPFGEPPTGPNPALSDSVWQAASPAESPAWQANPADAGWNAAPASAPTPIVAPVSAPTPIPPVFAPEPAPAPASFEPAQSWQAPVASVPTPLAHQPVSNWNSTVPMAHGFDQLPFDTAGAIYSPDQLARPLGWEAAGASALQAAAPEVATEYRPLVQIDPEPTAAADADMASAVFSELSSLAAERPHVNKTRAGLAKRTPVQKAEPTPIPDVIHKPVERDADAVRNRFSAFYTATRRNQSDVSNSPGDQSGRLTE